MNEFEKEGMPNNLDDDLDESLLPEDNDIELEDEDLI